VYVWGVCFGSRFWAYGMGVCLGRMMWAYVLGVCFGHLVWVYEFGLRKLPLCTPSIISIHGHDLSIIVRN